MPFVYRGERKIIASATIISNDFFSKKENIEQMILSGAPYEFTKNSVKNIINAMIDHFKTDVLIREYSPWWRWSKAMAYTSIPSEINLNVRRIDRPLNDIIGTIGHEYCHCADFKYRDLSFGHGGNSSIGKEKSLPYYVGAYLEKKFADKKQAS